MVMKQELSSSDSSAIGIRELCVRLIISPSFINFHEDSRRIGNHVCLRHGIAITYRVQAWEKTNQTGVLAM